MDSPFLGMVQYFAFDWVPKGYASANGALLSIQQNAALFALLGTFYGGNGTSTFALPDLRGRSIVNQSSSLTMGETFGVPSVTLLTTNLPSHTHSVPTLAMPCYVDNLNGGTVPDPNHNYPANFPGGTMYSQTVGTGQYLGAPTVTVGITGQNIPVNTQNPYIALTATISTVGLFPSRN